MEITLVPTLSLEIRSDVADAVSELQERGLIRLLKENFVRKNISPDAVDTVAITRFNEPYLLMDVGINWYEVKLCFHPEGQDELVMVIGEELDQKPLCFVFGLHSPQYLARKAKANLLSAADFLAIRWPYNDPLYSCFIIPSGVAHCELTSVNDLPAPRFFVVEPQNLILHAVDIEPYEIKLKLG